MFLAFSSTVDPTPFQQVIVPLLREAWRHADLSTEKAAHWMALNTSEQLHRELAGHGHLSLTRLAQLPPAFWQWFALVLLHRFGLPPVAQTARMLKMDLPAPEEKETVAR